jgi:hypothetical protein
VVLQVNAMNLLGIINRGSPKLSLNALERKLFWLCLVHTIIIAVELILPCQANALADEISKLSIPDDWSIRRFYYNWLNARWGPFACNIFSSNENNLCLQLYSLHWCRGTFGVNAFGFD